MATKTELEHLYRSYSSDIFRYAAFRTGNRELAEDITSETFFRVARQDMSQLMTPKAWLVAIARNVSLEMTRKQMQNLNLSTENEDSEVPEWADDTDFEKVSITESLLTMLKELVAKLDPETREVLSLRVWDEMPFGEIAKIRDEKEITVKQRFYRGVEKLRDIANEGGNKLAFTTGTLLSGIRRLMREPEYSYAPNSDLINLIYPNMETNIAPNTIGAPAAAPQLMSQKSIAKNMGMFVVAGGLLVTGIVIGANLLGRGIIVPNPDQGKDDQQTAANDIDDTTLAEGCTAETYTNADFTGFKFSYDNCKWHIDESKEMKPFAAPIGAPDLPYYTLSITNLTKRETFTVKLEPNLVTGAGKECITSAATDINDRIVRDVANGQSFYVSDPIVDLLDDGDCRRFSSLKAFDLVTTSISKMPYAQVLQATGEGENLKGFVFINNIDSDRTDVVDAFVKLIDIGTPNPERAILKGLVFDYEIAYLKEWGTPTVTGWDEQGGCLLERVKFSNSSITFEFVQRVSLCTGGSASVLSGTNSYDGGANYPSQSFYTTNREANDNYKYHFFEEKADGYGPMRRITVSADAGSKNESSRLVADGVTHLKFNLINIKSENISQLSR